MRIYSYNLNGIRAAMKKGLLDWVRNENPDILCVQETKAQEDQIDSKSFEELGYKTYWHSAKKKGYSGVGIVTKPQPDNVVKGVGNPLYDDEGRVIRADYGEVTLINIYHPSGTSGQERQDFKMQWLEFFLNWVEELRKERPYLIITGDLNIAHKEIDIHDPIGNAKNSGFLPEERAWVDKFLSHGYVDTFRLFHTEPHRYSWWTYRFKAREKNKGWRIDYFFVTENLVEKVRDADILENVVHSDHCPIMLDIDI